MVTIKINNRDYIVKQNITILEACKFVGVSVPRFCYHETLSIAGNCRMCLVEVNGVEKPVVSCLTEISENLSVYTDSLYVKKARENVVEALLLSHPLDCPICDQAGECDLQDQARTFGGDYSRFSFRKRGVEDKDCGPLIKTIMTRCIHCTRCVRFGSEIMGLDVLGTLNRGTTTEIGSYVSKFFNSEISGNVIDLCPVGALTSKSYAFKARPWELQINESIDTTDSTGSNVYINFKGSQIFRILPKPNSEVNENIISDKARFYYDSNYINRIKNIFAFHPSKGSFQLGKWSKFIPKFDGALGRKNFFNLFLNDDLDISSINFLKRVSNFYNNVALYSTNRTLVSSNFYVSNFLSPISSLKECSGLCIILSLNPRIECALINARLRMGYKNQALSLYSVGGFTSYSIPTSFISLNPDNFLSIFEGKFVNFSELFILANSPLVLIGESINIKFLDITSFVSLVKSFNNNAKFIQVGRGSNSTGVRFLNVRNINSNCLRRSSHTLALNLDDLFDLRKQFLKLKNKIVWVNSHGSFFALKSKMVIPTLTEFEDESILLNLEGRPQKTVKTVDPLFGVKSLKNILHSLFPGVSLNIFAHSAYLNFLFEIINNPDNFNSYGFKFCSSIGLKFSNFSSIKKLQKYPLKGNLEDFYCSSKSTKNSLVMQQCSQVLRKQSSNFNLF